MYRFMGTGQALLGVSKKDELYRVTATTWFTVAYLPVFPLSREYIRIIPTINWKSKYTVLKTLPIDRREVLKTYFYGWIVIPFLSIGPTLISIKEVYTLLNLPEAWHDIIFWCGTIWFGVFISVVAQILDDRISELLIED